MKQKISQVKAISLQDVVHYTMVSGFYLALSVGVFVLSSQ